MKKLKSFKRYYSKAINIIDYRARRLLFLRLRFLVVSNSKRQLQIRKVTIPFESDPITEYKCARFINHEYDILGSGWISNNCDSDRIDYSVKVQKKIHSMVDAGYLVHDWHRDLKSGFVWSDMDFCKDALKVVGKVPNLEIKYPWELSRLYHLPILAIGSRTNKKYSQEINNQLIDFYYSNPVGLGVNWSCTMDVGIRIHNILVSLSLYDSPKANKDFDKLVTNLILDHGNFIYAFLENKGAPNNNHYLANLLGLMCIAHFTEVSKKTIKWAVFAYKEFIREFNIQFHPDGSNFEGSSCYHALSTEMYLLFTAYTLGLSDEIKQSILDHIGTTELFDKAYISKLNKSIQFINDLSFTNGEIAQIGDNDSGYIFKLTNNGKMYSNGFEMQLFENLKKTGYKSTGQDYWDESLLHKNHLIDRFNALLPNTGQQLEDSIEKQFVVSIAKNTLLPIEIQENNPIVLGGDLDLERFEYKNTHIFNSGCDLQSNVHLFNYPDFGVCGYKAINFELIFSYSRNGLHGKGGHAHNDKLSFGLSMDGMILFSDPGTYLYHPDPEWRNYFRSTKVHNTIHVPGCEQNSWINGRKGIFRMTDQSKSEILKFDKEGLVARFAGVHYEHLRVIKIEKHKVIVTDYCDKAFVTHFQPNEYFSPGYGKLIKR